MPTRSRLLFAVTMISASVAGYSQPKPPASAAPPDDGNWVTPAKNYASTRFSELAEITADNVGTLKVEAPFSTGVLRGHEAAPIVYRDTMYLITPYPNRVYALDLTKPGLPQKWMYDPQPVPAAQGVACCDVVNRVGHYWDGMVFFARRDGPMLPMEFDIAMGVRKEDQALRNELNEVLERKRAQIAALLEEYGVPIVEVTE